MDIYYPPTLIVENFPAKTKIYKLNTPYFILYLLTLHF